MASPSLTDTSPLPMWRATVLTLFPEMFPGPLGYSLAGRALRAGRWRLDTQHIRDYGIGKHAAVDDAPYGGGVGMVLRPDVLAAAVDAVGPYNRLVYFSPRGKPLTHAFVSTLLDAQHIVLVCGRYEGVDQRFLDHYAAEEVCVGDAVLSGGEIPAMMLLDACVRRLPGVLDKGCAVVEESFSPEASYGPGILEYPLYTRPRVWRGLAVPETLCSGDHAAVSQWRAEAAWAVTAQRRPELLAGVAPTGVHAERR